MKGLEHIVLVGWLLICLVPAASAQRKDYVRTNSVEIGGFVGATYGVDDFRPMGGGNITYAVTKWLLPYAEYSYFPGIARTVTQSVPGLPNPTLTGTFSLPLSDFHGGVHLRMPIRESPIVPYAVFGMGALHHFGKDVAFNYVGADNLPHTLTAHDPAGTDFALNFGGGLRYYISQHFGIRVEAKAYKPFSDFTEVFGKVEGGVFLQLR